MALTTTTTTSFLAIFFLSNVGLIYSAQEEETYLIDCKPFYCGEKIEYIGFPFFNTPNYKCGLFEVNCSATKLIKLGDGSKWYDLISISQANTIEIRDQELQQRISSQSCDSFENFTLPNSPSISFTISNSSSSFFKNFTIPRSPSGSFMIFNNFSSFFKCTDFSAEAGEYFRGYHKYTKCPGYSLYYNYTNNHTDLATATLPPNCSVIYLPMVPKFLNPKPVDPFRLIAAQLMIGWHFTHEKEGKSNSKVILATGTFGAAIAILIIVVFSLRRKIAMKWRKKTDRHRNFENFIKNYGSLAPKSYRYSDIKKMTNSFKDKIGEGGYGSVYKGELCNGSLVAVKVLKESKGDGDEFFNEVASISRTSHVNVVTLLGFCFKGRKRALVYEFMANGSLEKFVYDGISSTNLQLGWDKSYRIAIGIARGLEYLHRGCNMRILHFDIKPHNILLDEDFVPKISDFGLAKLCLGKESTVSMLNARGTIGYIAPEVFCRNFGRVSHKSDVYSYGMMVLEMVGGRKNIEVEVGHTSEIYFPDWIYRKLKSDKELGMYGIMNEDENVYARKMIIVSLWCIQSDPSRRPSMSRVVEMLEGSLESLEIPPKPVLSSPPLSPTHSSTIEIS